MTLALTQRECHTCRLIWDAVTAILGEHWEQKFDRLSIPVLANDDFGPLRLQISDPHMYGQAWSSPDIQMQIYKRLGTFRPYKWYSHADSIEAPQLLGHT